MKKDIIQQQVKNISLAIVPEINKENGTDWIVYLINNNTYQLNNTIVVSRGYGLINEEERKTAYLRHFLETIEPNSFKKVEQVIEELFVLNNEFWVTFFHNNTLLDKKYVFLAETIHPDNLVDIPLLKTKGVLIK